MIIIESPDRILYHLEAVDIENDEYLFWDATGRPIEVKVIKNSVSGVLPCMPRLSLHEGFVSYLAALGLPSTLAEGPPLQVWARIQEEMGKRPKKPSWFRNLFAR